MKFARTKIIGCWLALAWLFLSCGFLQAGVIYVDPALGSDDNAGDSEFSAKESLTAAIAFAGNGDEIRLLGGYYRGCYTLASDNMVVRGDPCYPAPVISGSGIGEPIVTITGRGVMLKGLNFVADAHTTLCAEIRGSSCTLISNTFSADNEPSATAVLLKSESAGLGFILGGSASQANSFNLNLYQYVAWQDSGENPRHLTTIQIGANLFGGIIGTAHNDPDSFQLEKKIYHAVDNAKAGGLFEWRTGEVFVSPAEPASNARSISRALAIAKEGARIHLEVGIYDEAPVISKPDIRLVGQPGAIIQPLRHAQPMSPVITVSAPGVTVRDICISMNSSITSCGISVIGTKSEVAGINVLDNVFITTGSSGANPSSVAVRISNTGGRDQLTAIVQGNTFGTPDSVFHGDGLVMTGTLGVIGGPSAEERNAFNCSGAGLYLTEPSDGSVLIQNNTFNGSAGSSQFELVKPGPNAVVAIDGNRFSQDDATSGPDSSVRIQSDQGNNARVSFYRNVIASGSVGLFLDGLMNGYIHSNTFSAGRDSSTLLKVSAISDEAVSRTLILTGNTIDNPSRFKNVCGVEISGTVQDRTFVFGDARAPNMFGEDLESYIYLKNVLPVTSHDVIAVNNTFEINGQFKKPAQLSPEELARIRDKINDVGDEGTAGRVFLFAPVLNVNSAKYFSTVQAALDDHNTRDGDTLQLYPTTFTECLEIRKQVTLEAQKAGQGTGRPVLRSGNGGTKSSALIQVAAPNVIISDMDIDLSPAHVAAGIIGIDSNFDNIQIRGVRFASPQPAPGYMAVDLANLSRLPRKVTVCGNQLSGAGMRFQSCYGIIGDAADGTGNVITAYPVDMIVRHCALGEMVIRNNLLCGGGIEVSETQSSGKLDIAQNRFEPAAVSAQSLLLRHNYSGAPVNVHDNIFIGHIYRGILSAGSNNVMIDTNEFDTGTTNSLYRIAHIELNTQWPGPLTSPLNPNSCNVIGNSFRNTGNKTASAILIANGYAGRQSPDYSGVVVGHATRKNSFDDKLTRFLEYSETPDFAAKVDIDLQHNLFDTGYGLKDVPSRYSAENFRIEDKVYHKLDNASLGRASWNKETVYLTRPDEESTDSDLSAAVDLTAEANYSIMLEPGIYRGQTPVIRNKTTFTLTSLPGSRGTTISTGLNFSGNNRNISLQNIGLTVNPNLTSQSIIVNSGHLDGFSMNHVNIDGGNILQSGLSGGNCSSQVKLSNCRLSNIAGNLSFELFRTETSPAFILEDSTFENCTGSFTVDFKSPDGLCITSGNQFQLPESHYNSADSFLNICNSGMTSVIDNIGQGAVTSQSKKLTVLNLTNSAQLYLADNQIRNVNHGFSIVPGTSSKWASVINNTFTGCQIPFEIESARYQPGRILVANNQSDTTPITGQPDSWSFTAAAGTPVLLATTNGHQSYVKLSAQSGSFRGGETLHAYLNPAPPLQQFGGVPKSLVVRTSEPTGQFVATVAMSYSTTQISSMTETQLYLASWDPVKQRWIPAVSRNTRFSKIWMGASMAVDPSPENLGKYGVDPVNNLVWAVVDRLGEFTITGGTGTGAIPVNLSDFTIE